MTRKQEELGLITPEQKVKKNAKNVERRRVRRMMEADRKMRQEEAKKLKRGGLNVLG